MSECTDVKNHIAQKTGNTEYLQRLVILTEWHLQCLKLINQESDRYQFPDAQEEILFNEIKVEVEKRKSDLIQLDIKDLKFIGLVLNDYEVGKDVNFNMFLVESLLLCYISISEEIPKISTKDSNLTKKQSIWGKTIEELKANNKDIFDLNRRTGKVKIDKYLKTRRDGDSLHKICSSIESLNKIFEGNQISIQEKVLALQTTFHNIGEYLKDTQLTPNLSSDVRQSLEEMGIPAKRLSMYRDMLAHKQVFPLIERNDNLVKELFNDILLIQKVIERKIIEIEDNFIQWTIEESKFDKAVETKLKQCIRQKGFKGLETRIATIISKLEDVSTISKLEDVSTISKLEDVSTISKLEDVSTISKLSDLSQNVRRMQSINIPESSTEVSNRELSKTYLDSIIKYISQSQLNQYAMLREVVTPSLGIFFDKLNVAHDDVVYIQKIKNLLRYKGTSPPDMSILDNFLSSVHALQKVMVRNNRPQNRSLKQELELYFDAESFKKNDVYYNSNPKKLIDLLNHNIREPDDNTRKLITFFESMQSNTKIQDNIIPPAEYERLVKDLPIKSDELKEQLHSYSVEWRKQKCVVLLENNFTALEKIYDNILNGKIIDPQIYKWLSTQYRVKYESDNALEKRAASFNQKIKTLYLQRATETYVTWTKSNIPHVVVSQFINIFSLLEKAGEKKRLSTSRKVRNFVSHGDPLTSNAHIEKMSNKVVALINEVVDELNNRPTTVQGIREAFENGLSRFSFKPIDGVLCRGQSGRKRRYASESCLTWEEIVKFSKGGSEDRDLDNIRIDSEKFISMISSEDLGANEEKFSNLIALASESEVIGDHTSKVNMLTKHHRYLGHLGGVSKISGIVMHGMIAKDLVGDLLRGDYEDFTKTLGILVIGTGLQTAAEVASMKGAGYILKSRAVLGNTLKFASPFLSKGVTAFIAWDLYKQVQKYRLGDKDTLVSIVGDSAQLGVDAILIGIETGEIYGLWAGASAVGGPIGMAVGAVLFVGTDVFRTVRTVKNIDEYIHLNIWQTVAEGIRAFFSQQPSYEIEMLIDEKDANNQAVKHVTCFLQDNPHIRRYVVPSMEAYTIQETKKIKHTYTTNILDNVVLLNEKKNDIKWSRSRPGDVEGFDLFCLPKGDFESAPEGGTYYCDGAIGVEYTDNKTGNDTWIRLGNGKDIIKGFQGSSNIFDFGDGYKEMTGGNKNDNFIFGGKSVNATYDTQIFGFIDGGGGIDIIDVGRLDRLELDMNQVFVDFRKGSLKVTSHVDLIIHNINVFLGRKDGVDQVVCACDTKHVDGRGGENKYYIDSIIIPKDDACFYDTKVTVNPFTEVTNNATRGNFIYIVKGEKGKEAYIDLGPSSQCNNTFVFDYTLTDVAAIDKSEKYITFTFVEEFYKREKKIDVNSSFNLTVSGADKNTSTYNLIDGTKFVIGRNNVSAMQNTKKPIVCLVKDYSSLADKSQMYVVVLSNNEILVVGHSHGDVLQNDANAIASHLVGGGGENVFVISSGHEKLTLANLPISDVVIYDFDQKDQIDTLDLREIKEQLKQDIDRDINTVVSKICCDLLINLSLHDASKKEVVKITLKGALKNNWYKRVHIVIGNIFVIKEILGDFELTPQPLIFDANSKTMCVINPTDVAKGGKIRVMKQIGQYSFARDNDALVITNSLSSSTAENNLFTIILNDFYYGNNQDKMQSLKIEFDDKTILLRREIQSINSAGNFNELTRRVRIDSYKAVIYTIKEQKLFEAIEGNNIGEVKELMEHGVGIDARNNDGQTPLHIAALNGKLGVVKYLVEQKHADVNVNDNPEIKPSHCVVSGSSLDVIKYLVRNEHSDVNVKSNYGIKPLHYAAFGGNLEVVKYLVEDKHANVNVKDNYEISPLHYAASSSNSLNVVKYLVEKKHVDINVNDNYGITPLHYAALGGNLEVVKYLVEEKHVDVNVTDDSDITPLHYAASSSSLNVVKYLVEEKHADVNVKDDTDSTPLHYAASRSSLNVVKYLVEEKHADVNMKNLFKITPLHYAVRGGNLEVVKYLVEEKHADINVKDKYQATLLHHAASGSKTVNVNKRRSLGWALLRYAACNGNLELVKYLVEEKLADVNVKDDSDITPLHNAASSNSLDVAKYLVNQKHAGINVKESNGMTPLHLAVLGGNLEVVKYLVRKGADVNLKDHIGWTALHKAGLNGTLEMVKYLVGNGADVNLKNNSEMTPLHAAAEGGHPETVKYLIEKGAKIDIKTNGRTPLDILEHKGYKSEVDSIVEKLTERLFDAVKYDDHCEVQDLLNQGVSANVQVGGKETLLHFAARNGNLKVFKYLIERIYAGVNVKNYFAVTPLQEAVTNANIDVEKFLAGKVDDVNLKNIFRWIAASNGSLEMVKYRPEIKGVNLNLRTRFDRQTPLDLAVAGNYSNIVEKNVERKLNVKRETPQQHEPSHQHSLRRLLTTDSSNQSEIATSNASEKSSWITDLLGSFVKAQESSAPSETASSKHPIRHERRKRYNDHSRHKDGMRMRMRRVRHRHRRVQKRNVKYQNSHYCIDQPEIAVSSGTRPSSWINGLVDWIKEKGGGLVSSVANQFVAKESEDPKSRGIHVCSVRLEKMYSATIPNIQQSRKSQGVPKGNIPNTSWSGWSSTREKVTSNVTDAPEMNTTVLNNALILGDIAVRLINGTKHKQPIHENLLSLREKSMRFIDENMIMRTIQQGKEKFGGLDTYMDEEQDWN